MACRPFSATPGTTSLYGPDRLWDYLGANLEPSILASPDGHRWALAADALERCERIGGDALDVKLLKTISVIDLFSERSGLVASTELLRACFPDTPASAIEQALCQLDARSFTIFKKFLDAHAIFAGSDFDIDAAVRAQLEDTGEIDFKELQSLAGLQPVLAKRHYHETGALRWFDVDVVPVSELGEISRATRADQAVPRADSCWRFPRTGRAKTTPRSFAARRRAGALKGTCSSGFRRGRDLSCPSLASCLPSKASGTTTPNWPAMTWPGGKSRRAWRPCRPCWRPSCTRLLTAHGGSAGTSLRDACGKGT